MEFPDKTIWMPNDSWMNQAALTRLAKRLGVRGYDELIELSVAQPQRYWETVVDDLGVVWDKPPVDFCSLAAGGAYPMWFEGGRLNWVRTVFRHADDATRRSTTALMSESEDGEQQALTYADLDRRVRSFATGLKSLGIERGDRVGLMMPMGEEAVISLIAIAAIGAICVPLFTGFGAEAIVSRLTLAGAKTLIASPGFMRRGRSTNIERVLADSVAHLPALQHLIIHGHGDAALLGQYHHWDKVVAHKPCEQIESMGPNDPFMIVYTSGTTGMPKGTVHTHGGFPLKVTHDAAYHFELKADDRWLWPSDMGWIVGPLTTIGCLSLGATLVCYDGAPDAPDWSRLGSIIEKLRVTHFGASPTLIRGLAANESMSTSRDLVSLRVLMAAGEVLDPEHFEWFFDKFGRSELPIINYTGGTEASGALLANVVVRPIKVSGFNSVSPGIAAFVSDVDGHRLRGQPGELAIGAPFIGMTRSFWEDDERYFETYWSVTPGFWIHGDLAFEDRDGCFYILGRSDDTLKIAGKRVGPAEVENVVMRALAVVEVAAVGLPDPIKGQALVICAVRSNPAIDDDAFARSVSDVIEAALGKPFKPAIVHCVPALPRTRNGKVMRRVVRRILCGEAPGDLSALDNPESLRHLEARMPAGGLG